MGVNFNGPPTKRKVWLQEPERGYIDYGWTQEYYSLDFSYIMSFLHTS